MNTATKTNSAASGRLRAPVQHHRMRTAFGHGMVSGVVSAAIVAITTEAIAALATGMPPTGSAHLIAAVLTIVTGYIVMMIVALGELAHNIEASIERITANTQAFQARPTTAAASTTDAARPGERWQTACPATGGVVPITRNSLAAGALSGLLQAVEYTHMLDVEGDGYSGPAEIPAIPEMPIRESELISAT
jgi:hypothetical protein